MMLTMMAITTVTLFLSILRQILMVIHHDISYYKRLAVASYYIIMIIA